MKRQDTISVPTASTAIPVHTGPRLEIQQKVLCKRQRTWLEIMFGGSLVRIKSVSIKYGTSKLGLYLEEGCINAIKAYGPPFSLQ